MPSKLRLSHEAVSEYSSDAFAKGIPESARVYVRDLLPPDETPNKDFLLGMLAMATFAFGSPTMGEQFGDAVNALVYRAARMFLLDPAQASRRTSEMVGEETESKPSNTRLSLQVQTTVDTDLRIYHTRMALISRPFEDAVHFAENDPQNAPLSEVTRMLCQLKGVARVQVLPYAAIVKKSPVFAWEEVEPAVLDILKFQEGL